LKLSHGIIAIPAGPCTAGSRLNEPPLRAEVKWAIEKGATGVVAASRIVEFLHPDELERARFFEIVIEEASLG
jgi:dihydrodipicolinate synthase/N-acetylneuraminate lyase